jgi:predicted regulator of Ras-like GTPase activity (Roadblock/LC7/MglB family)
MLSEAEQTALLLDKDGLVLAGAYVAWDGRDVGQEVGAELSGVTDAARRATRHLALGEWTSIVFETEVAVVAMAPSASDGLLVLATSRATPLGLVRRLLDRCTDRARRWLGGRI